jgi:murein DD-endopeptidase MepM/ murein hydrolase activator NlpD
VSKRDGGLSLIVVPGGGSEPRSFEFSRRRLRLLAALGVFLGVAIVAAGASWVPLARRAARTDDLARQVDSLTSRQTRMEQLAQRIDRLEGVQDNYSLRLGVSGSADSALWVPAARASVGGGEALPVDDTATEPTVWPLTVAGAVTRSHLGGAGADHPGIDIAAPTGSYVRAAGGGVVVEAAQDPDYGLFVLIDHGNGVRTRYGHASYLVSDRGWTVRRGEVIALSGSTGRSTAPHLHFEILKNGRPIDPLSMVTPP